MLFILDTWLDYTIISLASISKELRFYTSCRGEVFVYWIRNVDQTLGRRFKHRRNILEDGISCLSGVCGRNTDVIDSFFITNYQFIVIQKRFLKGFLMTS